MADSFFLYAHEYTSIVQGTWNIQTNSNQLDQGFFRNTSTHADGDKVSYDDVYLAAGTWTVSILHLMYSDYGVLKIDIDGTEVASHDLYAASALYNQESVTTGISIATSGFKDIDVYVSGKNASSSDHKITYSHIHFQRTA